MRTRAQGRSATALLAALLSAPPLLPAPQEPPQPPRFGSGAEVVVLDVVVRDRKGRTIRDLRPEELQVYEDGVPQQALSFRLRAAGDPSPEPAAPAGALAAPSAPSAGPQPRASAPANLVTLVFDQLGPEGRTIARKAGMALARLGERDDLLVSVFQIRETPLLVQQFTSERRAIEDAVLRATGEVNAQYTNATDDLAEAVQRERDLRERFESMAATAGPESAAAAANLGRAADMARMAVDALRLTQTLQREQQGHSSLYSLLALSRQQQPLAGRKTILFFSEGIQVPPTLEHVLSTAISEANRANVSIYAVDARGLGDARRFDATRETLQEAVAAANRATTSQGLSPVSREEVLAPETAESALRMDVQGALADLASGTGGALIANTNDVTRGIERAIGDLRGYYELVYAPTNQELDGRFRKIEVKASRRDAVVQARSGYFALPPGEGTATFPFEVDLLRALRRHPSPQEFALRSSLLRFGPERGGLRYTLVMEIPLAGIEFAPDEQGELDRTHFSVLVVLRDATGVIVEKFSQDSPLFTSRQQRDELKRGNAVFIRSFAVPAGRYGVETAVVDQIGKRYSVRRDELAVGAPPAGLALSEIAVVKRTEAVPSGALPTEDPLRQGSTRIVPFLAEPSIGAGGDLSLFLVAYTRPGGERADLLLEVVRDGRVIAQTLSELPEADSFGRAPFRTTVPTGGLAPGRYEVRVLVKQGGLVAHQKRSFVIAGTNG